MHPRISVIVATTKPWPRLAPLVDALRTQAQRAGAEVIVVDGDGDGTPDDLGEPFVVVRRPGLDVFQLRAEAMPLVQGDIVALLEDHSYPDPDFCARLVQAFDAHPEAVGVVGTARNGAPEMLDDASFLLTWGPFLAPLDTVPPDRCAPPGVVSYRRSALPTTVPSPGWLEYELSVHLRDRGQVVADDRIRVEHVQHVGWGAFAIQFHAGRGYGGLDHEPRASVPRRQRLREALMIPSTLVRQTADGTRRSDWPHRRSSLGLVAMMASCNAAGQVVGLLRGPGNSPSHLE
jgi:hypothetical protein